LSPILPVFHRSIIPEENEMDLTRRHILRGLLGLPLTLLWPIPVRETKADGFPLSNHEAKGSISQFFKGEKLVYEIGFWIFRRVAVGTLSFQEADRKGQYLATLQGETVGLMGFADRYRVDTYTATMEEVDDGRRFRALRFEEHVKIGSKLRKRIHDFDYQNRKWVTMRRAKNGAMLRSELNIPPGANYDDFVTASYNFRYGVYGDIERGKRYTVNTFPRKGSDTYEVRVAGKEEEERMKRSEKVKDGKEYYVKLFLDPEVTHSKEGLIEGWLSRERYPVEGKLKDVFLFGDVTGRLIRKARS
jgi:hypothetical protein